MLLLPAATLALIVRSPSIVRLALLVLSPKALMKSIWAYVSPLALAETVSPPPMLRTAVALPVAIAVRVLR